jgi:hypothetical protein
MIYKYLDENQLLTTFESNVYRTRSSEVLENSAAIAEIIYIKKLLYQYLSAAISCPVFICPNHVGLYLSFILFAYHGSYM